MEHQFKEEFPKLHLISILNKNKLTVKMIDSVSIFLYFFKKLNFLMVYTHLEPFKVALKSLIDEIGGINIVTNKFVLAAKFFDIIVDKVNDGYYYLNKENGVNFNINNLLKEHYSILIRLP